MVHSKYFPVLKGVSPFVFPLTKNNTNFSVTGSITCSTFDVIVMSLVQYNKTFDVIIVGSI